MMVFLLLKPLGVEGQSHCHFLACTARSSAQDLVRSRFTQGRNPQTQTKNRLIRSLDFQRGPAVLHTHFYYTKHELGSVLLVNLPDMDPMQRLLQNSTDFNRSISLYSSARNLMSIVNMALLSAMFVAHINCFRTLESYMGASKIEGPFLEVLIVRIIVCGALFWDPLFLETPIKAHGRFGIGLWSPTLEAQPLSQP